MIPRSEIEAVRRVGESPINAEPHPFSKGGDRVRIKAGPLMGLEGVLVRKKHQWKFLLSVEMLERSVAVEVDAYMVERVHVSKPRLEPQWLLTNASRSQLSKFCSVLSQPWHNHFIFASSLGAPTPWPRALV